MQDKKYKCIESNCNNKVSKLNQRCWNCWVTLRRSVPKINGCYRHGNYVKGKIHYCIELGCKKEVASPNKKCRTHGQILRFSNLEERKKISKSMKGIKKPKSSMPLDKNPNWQNGISFEPYAIGWNKSLKEQVRDRDDHICQLCGKTEQENNQTLCVHHITYNKKNLDLKLLISLCYVCHTKTNYNRKYWQKYLSDIVIAKNNNIFIENGILS